MSKAKGKKIYEFTLDPKKVRWASRRFNKAAALPGEYEGKNYLRVKDDADALKKAFKLSSNMLQSTCEDVVEACMKNQKHLWVLIGLLVSDSPKGKGHRAATKALKQLYAVTFCRGNKRFEALVADEPVAERYFRAEEKPAERDVRNSFATILECLAAENPRLLPRIYTLQREIENKKPEGFRVLRAAFHDLLTDYGYDGYVAKRADGSVTVHTPDFELRGKDRQYRGIRI